jgi:coenzyme F420-reducing hydrogenase beta subunit
MEQGPISPAEIVSSGLCIGCGACAAMAESPDAAMRWDRFGQLKPGGDRRWRTARGTAFSGFCPFSPVASNEDEIADACFPASDVHHPLLGRFTRAYVGHAAEEPYRMAGSSGGMVSWVAAELLARGLVDGVAHVAPQAPGAGNGYFAYRVSRSVDALLEGAKSRYHPIHLADVLREIRAIPGRYAIIGIPCFIKAVHLVRAQDPLLGERIAYTLGLFCGHMKSARFVDSFAWQLGVPHDQVEAVDYRLKDPTRPANWYRAHLTLKDGSTRGEDWWHLADGDWGAGFFQNSACDMCDDVVAETADVAFGDAWVEPYSSDGRGTNVVIARSASVLTLIEQGIAEGRLTLREVDADFVVQTQEAGLRHRRQGLAYRLTWRRRGIQPRKRIQPSVARLTWRRRLVYRMRAAIARSSHRIAWLARLLGMPAIYTGWARASLGLYRALTYSHGRLGGWFDRLEHVWKKKINPDGPLRSHRN